MRGASGAQPFDWAAHLSNGMPVFSDHGARHSDRQTSPIQSKGGVMEHIADFGLIVVIAAAGGLIFGTVAVLLICAGGLGIKAVRSR